MSAPTGVTTAGVPAAEKSDHRHDIDGLRALAVVLVVLFHARVPPFTGGYIGVDVFFVISGYLITRLMVQEHERSGRLALSAFWARRARRLLPAATAVILGVLVAGTLLMSPLEWRGLAVEAGASALYVANFLFGAQTQDYFAADVTTRPLLHMWSLSVEEQFYLVWPVVTAALIALGARRRAGDIRGTLRWGIGAIVLGSFLLSLLLTARGSPWAYFATPSRAWELGIGALLAVRPVRAAGAGVRQGGALAALCLVALGIGAVAFDDRTPFPGVAALVPVVATALLIAAPAPAGSAAIRLLALRPVQWVGARSYSWYLWHWPVLVFTEVIAISPSLPLRSVVAVGSLLPAAAMYRWIEQPARHHRRLTASTRASLLLALGLILVTLAAAFTVLRLGEVQRSDPFFTRLEQARQDRPTYTSEGCDGLDPEVLLRNCRVGDVSSERLIVLVGDSHAEQWGPAIDAAAQRLGLRVIPVRRSSCPAVPVTISDTEGGTAACSRWQSDILALVDDLNPELVITSNSALYANDELGQDRRYVAAGGLQAWKDAVEELGAGLAARSIGFGVILDTPRLPFDPIECAARRRSLPDCRVPTPDATRGLDSVHRAEREAVADPDGTFDPLPQLCDASFCAVEIDGIVVYADSNHLTTAAAATFADEVEPWIRNLLAQQ